MTDTKCTHSLAEQETACADGMCPMCLHVTLDDLRRRLATALQEVTTLGRTVLPRCQYGVPMGSTSNPNAVGDCGEPAVARWRWKNGAPLYVCEEHDRIIEESEASDE